jgi:hypothetical protein
MAMEIGEEVIVIHSTRKLAVMAVAVGFFGFTEPAPATTITYQITGTSSGTIGGSSFVNALTTVALSGDTTNVTAWSACPTCLVNLGSTTVSIAGIGSAVVTDPTGVYSTGVPVDLGIGLPLLPYLAILVIDNPPATGPDPGFGIGLFGSNALLGYDLRSSIGSITAAPGLVGPSTCCTTRTSLGDLIFTSGISPTSQATLTVSTVPEPSSLLLFAIGALTLAGGRLRRVSW